MSRKSRYFISSADHKLGDRYELLECLGDGSYGWVWKSQRLSDDAIVAVKIPKSQGGTKSELAEGELLLNKPSHPNVVSVYWMGRVPPQREWYAIEMEYFPSNTLARLLDEGEQGFVSSYKRILNIYEQILQGVYYLHSLGMSHGDIKPQNILVAGDQAKLTDFGSSLLPEDIYTRTRENGGTVLYSAPEFAGTVHREKDSTRIFKGDIYSLGVLLYHLVTSRLPHDTLSQVIRHTPFPLPREINSSVSPNLENFVLRCLALNPEDRWNSVAEILTAFPRVKQAQVDYQPIRIIPTKHSPSQDWSSQTIELMQSGEYSRAEVVSRAEFEKSEDPHAFLLMISAAYKEKRYFDCLKEIERTQFFSKESSTLADIYRIALNSYIETKQIQKAESMLKCCLEKEGNTPTLLLKKASILGAQARYQEASEILISLNRKHPKHQAILKRLILVFEQLRDIGKASAFLRSYIQLSPGDDWAQKKIEMYKALSIL